MRMHRLTRDLGDRKTLYIVACMLFFWAICDSIMSFVSPLIMIERGMSATTMGLIIGSSSVAGAFFDFVLCRFLPNTNFRRVFAALLILSAVFPLIMWHGTVVWMYLIAMAVWGLYFDFYRVGIYDFVTRLPRNEEYSAYFGHIQVFIALGVLIAPFIAGFLIEDTVGTAPLVAALVFLGLGGFVYFLLLANTQGNRMFTETQPRPLIGLLHELRIWARLERKILPVLLVSFVLSMINAFYWTVGPLFAETFQSLGHFSSLFLMSFLAPALVVGWFVGKITAKYEQKRTALISLFLGSFVLMTLWFFENEYLIVAVNFIASFFLAAAYPALNGAYANFIAEAKQLEMEIETVEDSSVNLGWVVGPVLAGFVSDAVGYQNTFVVLGFLGVAIALVVWHIMPRRIRITPIVRE